jgi:hypothetical protein
MQRLLALVAPGRATRVLSPLAIATVVVMLAMGILDQPIKSHQARLGIVSFELAGDVPTAQAIVDSWDARARTVAGVGLGLDYLFMLAYSTTLAMACLWAANVFRRRNWALASVGVPLALGQWVAAVLDATENLALIRILVDGAHDPWPAVAWWAAVPKFSLLTLGVGAPRAAAPRPVRELPGRFPRRRRGSGTRASRGSR